MNQSLPILDTLLLHLVPKSRNGVVHSEENYKNYQLFFEQLYLQNLNLRNCVLQL